ncbi:MAG: magnesium transporter [Maribacter sp.]
MSFHHTAKPVIMIKYYSKTGKEIVELPELTNQCWVNISPPFSQEELEELAEKLIIPIDFLTDSLDIDERSRYEREDDISLVVVNTPVPNDTEEEIEATYITVPIGIIITPDNIITITSFNNPVLELFLEGKVKNFNTADKKLFVLQIFEQNVFRFLTNLKKLNLKRNLIEKELYDSSRSRELKQLLSIEKSLVYFLTSLSSNELLKMKMKRADLLKIREDEEKTDLFEDIIIDNSQALEMANTYTKIIQSTMESSASIISNNLNIVIQRLTLITIILMVPTLVASFFGMNTQSGLEESESAFYWIIIVSVILTLLLVWIFRRKKMI